MSDSHIMSLDISNARQAIEALMLERFRSEPFHNLRLIYGAQVGARVPGGTCSDKTLSFIEGARGKGFDASLHSGFIGGQEVHRLARIHIGRRDFFADVGNGWPALKLYPADEEIMFSCFGMCFRTEVTAERVSVFHKRRDRESLQLEIDVRGKPEREIKADIDRRFCSGITYPFSHSIRFSRIVEDQFLFLRGDRLEIHHERYFECMEGIDATQVPNILRDYFKQRGSLLKQRGSLLGTQPLGPFLL